jgi:hypothetical protein
MTSTKEGSNNVEVSPKLEVSPSAISRKIPGIKEKQRKK